MCKYNMRNDIGCKFLYDKTLIKIYDITGKICRTHNNWRIGAKRCFRGTCPERGGAGGENTDFSRLLINGRTSPYNETIGFQLRSARPCSPL